MIYNPGNNKEKNEIITLLHKGNEKALAIIFKHYHAALFYFAMQFLKDSLAAEDIVAESFIKIWQKRNDFDSLAAIKSFLYTTVKNASIDEIRQFNRHNACHEEIKYISKESEELFNDEKMIKAELLQKIRQDIEQLPPVRRKIFKMIYLEGLNTFEIARVLQISMDTVRVQKARALHTLRAIIKQRS
jgi:RNA polymerase sigma-19 factor, ECF subfamily